MELIYQPQFTLQANSNDITTVIKSRFISLRRTDEAGMNSDVLEITLTDNDDDNPITLPPVGAELTLSLGYVGNLQNMGLYVVDDFDWSCWPAQLVITAKATPFTASKDGKSAMQSHKTRSWPVNTTIGNMVAKIASDNGMQPAVSASLSSIQLPHIDQTDESDLNLLVRTAKKFDAVVKPAGGKLVFAKKGEAKTMSGVALPPVTLSPGDVSRCSVTVSKREVAAQVTAYYHDLADAQRHAVVVGSGQPNRTLKMTFPTQAQAKAAASAELARRGRGETTVRITMPGNPGIMAEQPLTLDGFRDWIDGDYTITRVDHSLDDAGYSITLEAELPNSTATPTSADDAE